MLVYLKALQYSMSESDHLNSTNNTGNTFISLDQASTIMADQTQGGNPQQKWYCYVSFPYSLACQSVPFLFQFGLRIVIKKYL